MKKTGTLITGYCAAFALALTVASYSAAREGTHESKNLADRDQLYSDLRRDAIDLASDIRRLRHDLRRRAGLEKIADERNSVGEDWRQIVRDRNPNAHELGGPTTGWARLRRHGNGRDQTAFVERRWPGGESSKGVR